MEKDIHASRKGQGAATNREKKDRVSLGQGRALQQLFNLCSNSPCSSEHKLFMYNNPSLRNFWFVDKTNKDKLVMKLSGAVTISIYYLSIIHHHIHIIIYNNENHIYCPSWKETLSLLLLYNYIVHIYKGKIQYWNIHNNCSHKHN